MSVPVVPLRLDLDGVEPYGAPQCEVEVRLNVNENPYPPSPELQRDIAAAVADVAHRLNRYADRDAIALRHDLASYLATESGVVVDGERVWAANGSNEVMTQLLQAFGGPGRVAASCTPTYSMYPEYARDTNTGWVCVARRHDHSVDVAACRAMLERECPSILFLASPNNPTGTALDLDDIDSLCRVAATTGPRDRANAATIIVVDEAYAEFRRDDVPSALTLLDRHSNLVVTRTMSKAFAMAGLRLGYMVAHPEVIDAVMRVRLPYHLSALTQAAARAALSHADALSDQIRDLRARRDDLIGWLRAIGCDACDSDANFVLFGRFPDAKEVFDALLARGVLIRVVGPPGYLRVSIGTENEDRRFRQALKEVIDGGIAPASRPCDA